MVKASWVVSSEQHTHVWKRGARQLPTCRHELLPEPARLKLSAVSWTECPLLSAKMYHVHDRLPPTLRFPSEMRPPPNAVEYLSPLGLATM